MFCLYNQCYFYSLVYVEGAVW